MKSDGKRVPRSAALTCQLIKELAGRSTPEDAKYGECVVEEMERLLP